MDIVVLDGNVVNPGDQSWAALKELGGVTVHGRTKEREIIKRIGRAPIILTNKTPITQRVIEACPQLKYIGVMATGYNVVDTVAAARRGIVVTNIPAYSTEAVAQFTFALLLEICHHVGSHNQSVKEGDWQRSADFSYWHYPLIELSGKTLGIVGYGRIGQKVAEIGHAFGMKVLAYRPSQEWGSDTVATLVPLDKVLANADVLSLHCPLTPETDKMMNKERIREMKDGVILLNTSRGQLLDEQAVAEALNQGKISAAGVDVVSQEPIQPDNPLLGAKNIFITPHIAWAAQETRERLMNILVANVEAFLQGKPINVVNL